MYDILIDYLCYYLGLGFTAVCSKWLC